MEQMTPGSPVGAIAVLVGFLSLTFFVPILLFGLSQKLLARPFGIARNGLGRMMWSGLISFSIFFALPVGLSLFPLLGTLFGVVLVFPVGAYVMQSLHGLAFWPAFGFNISSYVLYMLIWVALLFAVVALLGGTAEVLRLVEQYIDLESVVEKLFSLFSSGDGKNGL